MRNIIKKIKSKSGETFVEIIVAILIVAFGCVLIGTMYTSSFNMNLTAKEKDDAYYSNLNDMTASDDSTGQGQITITDNSPSTGGTVDGNTNSGTDGNKSITVTVDEYGSDDLTSYRKHKEESKEKEG